MQTHIRVFLKQQLDSKGSGPVFINPLNRTESGGTQNAAAAETPSSLVAIKHKLYKLTLASKGLKPAFFKRNLIILRQELKIPTLGNMIKSLVFTILLFSFVRTFCQTLTVRKLYEEYRSNKYTFQNRYKNQNLTITGKVRSISRASDFWKDQDVHRVHLTATGYENFVVCQIPYKDSTILNLVKVGEYVTVTGTTSSNIGDAIFLSNCLFTAANPNTKNSSSPDNAPLGKYHVYQTDGKGFNYQYAFDLKSYQTYVLNGEVGKCSYSAKTKSITFSTGPLKGFAGLYRKTTENKADPPSFLLNPKGTVPVAKSTHQGYQLGYYQGK